MQREELSVWCSLELINSVLLLWGLGGLRRVGVAAVLRMKLETQTKGKGSQGFSLFSFWEDNGLEDLDSVGQKRGGLATALPHHSCGGKGQRLMDYCGLQVREQKLSPNVMGKTKPRLTELLQAWMDLQPNKRRWLLDLRKWGFCDPCYVCNCLSLWLWVFKNCDVHWLIWTRYVNTLKDIKFLEGNRPASRKASVFMFRLIPGLNPHSLLDTREST